MARLVSIVVLTAALGASFPVAPQDGPVAAAPGDANTGRFATPITEKLFPDLVIPEKFERGFLNILVNMSGRDIPKTVKDTKALLDTFPSERDRNLRALVVLELAVIHFRAREYQASWTSLDWAFAMADFEAGCFGRVLRIYGLRFRSRLQFIQGEFSRSWKTLQKALALVQKFRAGAPRCTIPARLAEGRVYEAIGRREYNAGNYDEAVTGFTRAASIYLQLGAKSNAEDFYYVVSKLDKLPLSDALSAYLERFRGLERIEYNSPNHPGLVIEAIVFQENLFLDE